MARNREIGCIPTFLSRSHAKESFFKDFFIAFARFSKAELQKGNRKKAKENPRKLKNNFLFKRNVILKLLKNCFRTVSALFGNYLFFEILLKTFLSPFSSPFFFVLFLSFFHRFAMRTVMMIDICRQYGGSL